MVVIQEKNEDLNMALELKSNSEYKGDLSQLPGANAPMPDNASLYLDFTNGLYLARTRTRRQ